MAHVFDIQAAAEFIVAHAGYAGAICFIIALTSSLLGPNLVVPSGAILNTAGVLVGTGLLPWTIAIWGACGAMVGTGVSYAVGALVKVRVRGSWPVRRWPDLMDRAEAVFLRHGPVAIFVGYFSGPLRAPVACVAGAAGMPLSRFLGANFAAAALWGSFEVSLGAVPGALAPTGTSPFVLVLVALSITVAMSAAVYFYRRWS